MPSIYIVSGITGERGCRQQWTVAAYLDEASARRRADLAKRWYQEHIPPQGSEDWGWWGKYPNPYDPTMRVASTDTDWIVTHVDLYDQGEADLRRAQESPRNSPVARPSMEPIQAH